MDTVALLGLLGWRWSLTKIRYGVFGDVHLMHHNTPTDSIIDNFKVVFNNYKTGPLSSIDMLFMAGDLFDQVRDAEDPDFLLACMWINRLMAYCSEYKIKLRFLKGTPSHDGNQVKISRALADNFHDLDFSYIEDISIEYVPDLNIRILYIPDECRDNNRLIYEDVQQLMMEKGLATVDVAIMHGMFSYQANYQGMDSRMHYEKDYLKIVKHFINIAHVHTHSVYERILAQGSFSRLSHGEEEEKGMMVMTIDTDNKDNDYFEFIPNKDAQKYVTVKLINSDPDKSWNKLSKAVHALKPFSYVRVQLREDHPFYSGFNEVKAKYTHLHFKKQKLDKDGKPPVHASPVSDDLVFIPLQITNENIVDLIMEQMSNQANVHDLLVLRSELETLK